MNQNLKHRIFSWLLLVLFAYNIVGCYATFFVWKIMMHERIEKLASILPNEKLSLIKLSSTEKIEKEICVEGKMFDVIRVKEINGTNYCYCLRDFEEETLSANISDDTIFSKAKNDLSKAIKSLQKNNSEKFTSPTGSSFFFPQNIFQKVQTPKMEKLLTTFIVINYPPPKFIY